MAVAEQPAGAVGEREPGIRLVVVDATGYALNASAAASLRVIGVAEATVDNSSGANGDLLTLNPASAWTLNVTGTAAASSSWFSSFTGTSGLNKNGPRPGGRRRRAGRARHGRERLPRVQRLG